MGSPPRVARLTTKVPYLARPASRAAHGLLNKLRSPESYAAIGPLIARATIRIRQKRRFGRLAASSLLRGQSGVLRAVHHHPDASSFGERARWPRKSLDVLRRF